MIYRLLLSAGVLVALPFIMVGLVNVIAWLNTPRRPYVHRTRLGEAARRKRVEGLRNPRQDPDKALAELKPRILAKEDELASLRAEEFRLSLETGRIRDPYRGGVTDDCVQMPALTDDVLRGASGRKA